jgi:hypothetical protein
MRISSLITAVALLATTVFAVEIVGTSAAQVSPPVVVYGRSTEHEESYDVPVEDPVLSVTASFPESNPFGRMSRLCRNFLFPPRYSGQSM